MAVDENGFPENGFPENSFLENSSPEHSSPENSSMDTSDVDEKLKSVGFYIQFSKSGCKKYHYPTPKTVEKWKNPKARKQYSTQKEDGGKKIKLNQEKQQLTNEQNFKKVIVAARKGNPQRELTSASVHSVCICDKLTESKDLVLARVSSRKRARSLESSNGQSIFQRRLCAIQLSKRQQKSCHRYDV